MVPADGLIPTIIEFVAQSLCIHCSSPGVGQSCWTINNLGALASLCRVSSRVRTIATPFLYHYPVCIDQAVILLIRTLKQRPDLLAHIRLLGLSSRDSSKLDLPKVGLLLAAQCPNLEDLDLDFHRWSPAVPHLARDLFLHNLQRLVVRRVSPNIVGGVISWCPNLVALELFETQVSPTFPTLPRIKDTLRELKLLHTVLAPGRLSELMEALPNLESFSYVEGLPVAGPTRDLLAGASEIKQALLSRAANLRRLELNLSARKYRVKKLARPPDDQLLGSLRGLTALKELVLGAWYVTVHDGWTSFADDMALVELPPASIRSIKLEIFGGEYTASAVNFAAVMNLAAHAPERFPDLRVAEFTFTGMTRKEIYEMKNAFRTRDIEFLATSTSAEH